MSYCRMGKESDVYVYPSVNGGIVCFWCKTTPTRAEMISHLEEHRKRGNRVPQRAIDRLKREIDKGWL